MSTDLEIHEERKEESQLCPVMDTTSVEVKGIVRFWEENEKLMAKCYLLNQERTFTLIRQVELEMADNIFDYIYLIHQTAIVNGLNIWHDIEINYLSIEDFDTVGILRYVLLTFVCEKLNQIEMDL